MSQRNELIPQAVRIAVRNAVGGWGPYSVREIIDLFPEADDQPGSPGRVLRRALERGGFVGADGRLRLPGPPGPSPQEPDVEGIWLPDRPRIFLSHVNSVRAEVTQVAEALERLQCSCFVAHVQIEPSRHWQDVI